MLDDQVWWVRCSHSPVPSYRSSTVLSYQYLLVCNIAVCLNDMFIYRIGWITQFLCGPIKFRVRKRSRSLFCVILTMRLIKLKTWVDEEGWKCVLLSLPHLCNCGILAWTCIATCQSNWCAFKFCQAPCPRSEEGWKVKPKKKDGDSVWEESLNQSSGSEKDDKWSCVQLCGLCFFFFKNKTPQGPLVFTQDYGQFFFYRKENNSA